jgi:hypothetical protein
LPEAVARLVEIGLTTPQKRLSVPIAKTTILDRHANTRFF